MLAGYNLNKIKTLLNKTLNSKISWEHPYGNNVSEKILRILKKNYKR